MILTLVIICLQGCQTHIDPGPFDQDYHIVWDTQSENSSESMPLVGGDIGCNVWVENGEILLYMQRSGSMSENGEYLKLGRIRLQMSPNPMTEASTFSQELKLQDGYIEIASGNSDGHKKRTVRIRIWVEVTSPVIHLDVDANFETEVIAHYESWRTENRELLDIPDGRRERFACFSLEGYPGKVVRVKDEIRFDHEGILFYHRNPREKLVPEVFIKQQGLEASANEIFDDLKDRTFGGLLIGEGFVQAGTGKGNYQETPYQSWAIKSGKQRRKHRISVVTHIAQAEFLETWKEKLYETAAGARGNQKERFDQMVQWWNRFWDRSHIVIYPGMNNPADPAWQMGRNYQLFRYQLGGNYYGEYPTKFNGGSLTFDPVLVNEKSNYGPDWRQWDGAFHTAQNQRLDGFACS